MTNGNPQMLAMLSGKGGSGKTIIALSMSKVLCEAGYKVLLVDCDMSTHGATYFFEGELGKMEPNTPSLYQLMRSTYSSFTPFKTNAGFYFVPSTLDPATLEDVLSEPEEIMVERALTNIDGISAPLDAIIFDCQAGYSRVAKRVASKTNRNLIVLEPDAVSSAALRVLYLQMGTILKTSNTWQIFNKLTEDERPIYEKIFGGTLFTNLPPVPFDWHVRAAFATGKIPSVTDKWSAFGLGVLRVMSVLFPPFSQKLSALEKETVGKWHEYLMERVTELNKQKREIKFRRIEIKRRQQLTRTRLIFNLGVLLSALVGAIGLVTSIKVFPFSDLFDRLGPRTIGIIVAVLSMLVAIGFAFWYSFNVRSLREEREQDSEQESIGEIETELNKYITLLATDPNLREYEKAKVEGVP